MTTYATPNKYSDAPEVAGFSGIEASGRQKYDTTQSPALSIPTAPPPPVPSRESRRICGLRRTTFFLSLALATVVVLAAAIGGGVGASTCSSSSSKNVKGAGASLTSTVTVTSTLTKNSATQTPTSSGAPSASTTVTTTCPFSNNTVYSSQFNTGANGTPGPNAGLDYVIYCNMNFATGLGPHLAQVYAITFTDCIEACASYNFWGDTTDCEQVAYKLDGNRPGNCWIGTKNASESLSFETSALDIAFLQ